MPRQIVTQLHDEANDFFAPFDTIIFDVEKWPEFADQSLRAAQRCQFHSLDIDFQQVQPWNVAQ